jgi:hypothetical protein
MKGGRRRENERREKEGEGGRMKGGRRRENERSEKEGEGRRSR